MASSQTALFLLFLCCSLHFITSNEDDQGVHSLTISEALSKHIPLSFSHSSARSALESRYTASLSTSPLQAHLPALRQLSSACTSAAEFGSRGSGTLWALLAGLSDGQDTAQRQHAAALAAAVEVGVSGSSSSSTTTSSSSSRNGGVLPLPVFHLTSTPWGYSQTFNDPEAIPALLGPLGKALGVVVTTHPPSLTPFHPHPPADLWVLDGARCYASLLRDLQTIEPLATRFIVIPFSTEFGLVSGGVREEGGKRPPLDLAREWGVDVGGALEATVGLKAALFDFLAAFREKWEVRAMFDNGGGITVLARKGG